MCNVSVCVLRWEMLRESIVGKHPLFTAAEFLGTNLLSNSFFSGCGNQQDARC